MAHVMQSIGLTKKLKELQRPDSSSTKAKGHGFTEGLKAKTHLRPLKIWPDKCVKQKAALK